MTRIYEISIPHFTDKGNFVGAVHELGALKALDIDAVYLLPINITDLEVSRSPYCISDHWHVRQELGGFEGLEFFTRAAHELNMQVIMDVVLNHASENHLYSQDEDYFAKDAGNKPYHPIDTNWTDVFQINHSDLWFSYTSLNILLNFLKLGVDGFRFDATSFLPDYNLESWLSGLIQTKPDIILWSDSNLIEKDTHPFTHVSAPIGKVSFPESRKAIQIASLGSHDMLRNQGSLLEVYGENVCAIQQKLILQSEAFLFPMGSEKGFDFKYDFFL